MRFACFCSGCWLVQLTNGGGKDGGNVTPCFSVFLAMPTQVKWMLKNPWEAQARSEARAGLRIPWVARWLQFFQVYLI